MSNVTVGEVLRSREALLVQFAAEKRLGITAARRLLQTVARQTQLRNAVRTEAQPLSEVSLLTYREYERWLRLLLWRFSFDNRSSMIDELSARRTSTLLTNVSRASSSRSTYGFGLEESQDRDPWAEITVGCVRQVAELVASIKEDALGCVRHLWPRIDHQEPERYIEFRLSQEDDATGAIAQPYVESQPGHEDCVISDIAKPVARIVCLAMSTNPKSTRLRFETWPSVQSRFSPDGRLHLDGHFPREAARHRSWHEIIEAVVREVRRWEDRKVPVLIVLDCALGWPRQMASAIEAHAAGHALPEPEFRRQEGGQDGPFDEDKPWYDATPKEEAWRDERNQFFRRRTEIHVRECLRSFAEEHAVHSHGPYGPPGLDIGADKSARTTHQALRLIGELRRDLKRALPVLTISCGPIAQSSVIEVTTVEARRLGRRLASRLAIRERAQDLDRDESHRKVDEDVDLRITAAVDRTSKFDYESWCRMELMLRSASEFLDGGLSTPGICQVDEKIARKEGWIWWRVDDSPDS